MLNFPRLTEQDKKDADCILSIKEAQKRSPKEESHIYSFVAWGKHEPEYLEVLEGINSVRLAIPPELPRGYYMENHESWRRWYLTANDKMVNLCKTASLKEIYDFNIAVERYISEVRNKYKINLCSYWECTYDGHEKPNFPSDLYAFGECEDANKKLQQMTADQIYQQLMTISPRDDSTHAWLDEVEITGTTIDEKCISLKDSDVKITSITSVHIGVLHHRKYTDKYFEEI